MSENPGRSPHFGPSLARAGSFWCASEESFLQNCSLFVLIAHGPIDIEPLRAARRRMAIRVFCQACHRDAHFRAADLIAHGTAPGTHIEDVRFRCSTCRSRKRGRALPI